MVTDAWRPHVSGVLRVVESLSREFEKQHTGYTILHPQDFPRVSLPLYRDIKLALPTAFLSRVDALLLQHPNARIHIMTEGPLGLTMRNYCLLRKLAFTTSFHTHWHSYARIYLKVPQRITLRYIKDFHAPAARIIVPSEEIREELQASGFSNDIAVCANGVDTTLFAPSSRPRNRVSPRLLYVGRVSREKNIESFLSLPSSSGTKQVVGDGPLRALLERQYPDVVFSGLLEGEQLREAYRNADVFVFPSMTDTFGIVMLEALASGVPVAAYPARGAQLLITDEKLGALDEHLERAVTRALEKGDRKACVSHAEMYSWEHIAAHFLTLLVPAGTPTPLHAAVTDHVVDIPSQLTALFSAVGYVRPLFRRKSKGERTRV